MTSVACPHCGVANQPQQSKWFYCEKCGGRLPGAAMPTEQPATARSAGAVSTSTATLARPRTTAAFANYPMPGSAARMTSKVAPRTTAHPMAYVVIVFSIVVGASVMLAINNGKADYVWIGCGVGAGAGVFIAQLLGLWPKKGPK